MPYLDTWRCGQPEHLTKIGAVDGNRTRLKYIDSVVPSQSATTALNLVQGAGFEPTLETP